MSGRAPAKPRKTKPVRASARTPERPRAHTRNLDSPSVAVFGATVAGWATAQRLAEAGFRVAIVADGGATPAELGRAPWTDRRAILPFSDDGPMFPRAAPLPEATFAEPVPAGARHLRALLADIPATDAGRNRGPRGGGDGGRRRVLATLLPRAWTPLGRETEPLAIFRFGGSPTAGAFVDGANRFVEAGHQIQDGTTFIARVLRFLTSSPRRRAAECEDTSMLEYLRGTSVSSSPRFNYSEGFLAELRGLPDVGVGLGHGLASVRTEARAALDAYVQALTGAAAAAVTAARAGPNGPATTSATTSATASAATTATPKVSAEIATAGAFVGPRFDAWVAPWRRHLERLGVDFVTGRLARLEIDRRRARRGGARGSDGVRAAVEGASASTRDRIRDADFFVVATDAASARDACAWLPPTGVPGGLRGFAPPIARAAADADRGAGPARWRRTGEVALFLPFALDLHGPLVIRGSAWGLVARQQLVFDARGPTVTRDGFGCVLSVRIGAWNVPSPASGKTAAECDPRDLAREVWSAIAPALAGAHARRSPVWFACGASDVVLDVLPGDWSHRPSEPSGLHLGRLVFAGDYLKTCTRAPGIEAACESAARAARELVAHARASRRLAAAKSESDRPAVDGMPGLFDPENHEPPELAPLKTLDAWCMEQRLPHIFEITGLDAWISAASWLGFLDPATQPFLRSVVDLGSQLPTDGGAGPRAAGATSYQEAGLAILKRMREALETRARNP